MLRAVTKISSCRVYAVSRWETEEPLKESFWSNFPFVSYKKARGNPRPPAPGPRPFVTAMMLQRYTLFFKG